MSAPPVTIALAVAVLFCALVAGFLAAFALVVMPGLKTLDDAASLRAFQRIDGVIQGNQPLFMILWVGSILATLAALGVGGGALAGGDRILLLAAGALYLGGVQVPTITVHLPLNGRVQALDLDTLDARALREARAGFEARWIRWNALRTMLATVSVGLMLVLLVRL